MRVRARRKGGCGERKGQPNEWAIYGFRAAAVSTSEVVLRSSELKIFTSEVESPSSLRQGCSPENWKGGGKERKSFGLRTFLHEVVFHHEVVDDEILPFHRVFAHIVGEQFFDFIALVEGHGF